MFTPKLFFALAAVAITASAAVLNIITPPVTSPKAGDVWAVGSVQTITWEVPEMSPISAGESGSILLGFLEDGSSNEHLDVDHPLAANVRINAGAVNVTVPAVASRDDYIIALFGDSSNISPKFTITN